MSPIIKDDRKKIVITGGSGFLARRIVFHYGETHDILTPTHQELDITDAENCMEYMKKEHPDVVIHCAAIASTVVCEENPRLSKSVNVEGPIHIAKACKSVGAKMIYASSDQVYNGSETTELGVETDIVAPINVYGRDKIEAENAVMEIVDAVCLRLPWMCDKTSDDFPEHADFYSNFCNKISKREVMMFSPYDLRSITNVHDVAENIIKTISIPGGVYNFASTGKLSSYEIAKGVIKNLYPDDEEVQALIQIYPDATPERGRNLTMDMSKLEAYGIYFPDSITSISKLM
ncbi:MAG: sugar nucleotide-binding protein [Eubacteriales bacterium]